MKDKGQRGGGDVAASLAMLHTAVTQSGQNIRDDLRKDLQGLATRFEDLQVSHKEALSSELGKTRENLRETRNHVAGIRTDLTTELQSALASLQQAARKITERLDDTNSVSQPASCEPSLPAATAPPREDAEPAAAETRPATETRVLPGPRLPGEDSTGRPAGSDEPGGPAAPLDAAALAELVRAELAPVHEKLAAVSGTLAGQNAVAAPTEPHPAPAAGTLADEVTALHARQREHTAQLTRLRDLLEEQALEQTEHQARRHTEVRELLTEVRDLLGSRTTPQEPADPEAGAPVSQEHGRLLTYASRIASASLVCHPDLWEYLAGQAGRHPHFRMPTQITVAGEDRVCARLSGRSLIATLSALHNAIASVPKHDADWALATTVYKRIAEALEPLGADGERITIALDDRAPLPADGPSAAGTGKAPATSGEEDRAARPEPAPPADPGAGTA
ncbi:hypothetical protein [Streptomyces cacaoi]